MSVIQVMDQQLSNMIAAGEVVDRPVNIVKECMENSLDAGASSIDIEVFEGGIGGVIVTDDGCGMDFEDAALAFERHATSKLHNQEELFAISTMGFRGEALPSIAAVAEVELKTSNGRTGTRVRYEYGEQILHEKADCPLGTRIEVRGLFVRTPARFKYLKKPAYEFSVISDVVSKFAIAHPDLRISLRHDGRMVFRTSGKNDRREIFYQMFGREAVAGAVPFQASSDDYRISGLAVQPKISRAGKQYIYVSINGRLVRSWPIVNAVVEGYREFLPRDRYPIVYLNIEVDPQLIDVNVHPNKWEVRISKEEFLASLIIETLSSLFEEQLETPAVSRRPVREDNMQQPQLNLFQARTDSVSDHRTSGGNNGSESLLIRESRIPYQPSVPDRQSPGYPRGSVRGNPLLEDYTKGNQERSASFLRELPEARQPALNEQRQRFGGILPAVSAQKSENQKSEETADSEIQPVFFKSAEMEPVQPEIKTDPVSGKAGQDSSSYERGPEFFRHLRVIGQLRESYILCENPDGLVIIDQHAAQERANFEKLMKEFDQRSVILQPLMLPIKIDLPLPLMARIDEINEAVEPYGLHFEAFGNSSVVMREVPDWMENVDKEEFLSDLMSRFHASGKPDMDGLRRHFIATMACHSSIRFNRPLTNGEMEQVIEDLQHCSNPYHCPHGRPTVITFPDHALRKEFERG